MSIATDEQVQKFSDERIRVRAEAIRALYNSLNDDIAAIDSVYANLTQQSPTWVDNRLDGPPNLLTKDDILAINAFINNIRDAIKNNAGLPVVLKACVRAV